MDHKKTVRDGYKTIANQYLDGRNKTSKDVQLLDNFMAALPKNAKVLDAGCGAGIPVARILGERFDVTGVDFSEAQIKLAKENVPNATFICQDMTELDFPKNHFDGICSYYAVIHLQGNAKGNWISYSSIQNCSR